MIFSYKLEPKLLEQLIYPVLHYFIQGNQLIIIEQLYQHFQLYNMKQISNYPRHHMFLDDTSLNKSYLNLIARILSERFALNNGKSKEAFLLLDEYIRKTYAKDYDYIDKALSEDIITLNERLNLTSKTSMKTTKKSYKTNTSMNKSMFKLQHYLTLKLYMNQKLHKEDREQLLSSKNSALLYQEYEVKECLNLAFQVEDIHQISQYKLYRNRVKLELSTLIGTTNISNYILSNLDIVQNSNNESLLKTQTDAIFYAQKHIFEQLFLDLAYGYGINKSFLRHFITKERVERYFQLVCDYNLKYFIQNFRIVHTNSNKLRFFAMENGRFSVYRNYDENTTKKYDPIKYPANIDTINIAGVESFPMFFTQLLFTLFSDLALSLAEESLSLYYSNADLLNFIKGSKESVLQKDIERLNNENSRLLDKVKAYEINVTKQSLEESRLLNKQYKKDTQPLHLEIKALKKLLDQKEKQIHSLDNKVNDQDDFIQLLQNGPKTINSYYSSLSDEDKGKLYSKRILFLGGRDNITDELSVFFKFSTFISNPTTYSTLLQYDYLVVFYRYCNHALYYRWKEHTKDKNIPIIYIDSTNSEYILSQLYQEIWFTEC